MSLTGDVANVKPQVACPKGRDHRPDQPGRGLARSECRMKLEDATNKEVARSAAGENPPDGVKTSSGAKFLSIQGQRSPGNGSGAAEGTSAPDPRGGEYEGAMGIGATSAFFRTSLLSGNSHPSGRRPIRRHQLGAQGLTHPPHTLTLPVEQDAHADSRSGDRAAASEHRGGSRRPADDRVRR